MPAPEVLHFQVTKYNVITSCEASQHTTMYASRVTTPPLTPLTELFGFSLVVVVVVVVVIVTEGRIIMLTLCKGAGRHKGHL